MKKIKHNIIVMREISFYQMQFHIFLSVLSSMCVRMTCEGQNMFP